MIAIDNWGEALNSHPMIFHQIGWERNMMKALSTSASLRFFVCFSLFPATAHAVVSFDWAVVGNPGNAPDSEVMSTDSTTGYGAVDHAFRISKYEVTNTQYAEFLNAVDPAANNSLNLYSFFMSSDANGGISKRGNDGYFVKAGHENEPVVFVDFIDVMRFANWLNNGQGNSSTETGVYNIASGLDETRAPNARIFIPNENEWYKAAYHKNDGVTGNYWDYPMATDLEPFSDQPPGNDSPDSSRAGNFYNLDDNTNGTSIDNGYNDGFAATGSQDFGMFDFLTDVGAYSAAPSPYGTFDQGGNVVEWIEDLIEPERRGVRGGGWFPSANFLRSNTRLSESMPTNGGSDLGFRVAAAIPEPWTEGLLLVATILACCYRGRPLS